MTDIKEFIISTLTSDGTIRTLTGASIEDPRIYWYYQGDAEVTPTKPAYITYALIADPEVTQAVASPIFSFIIWGRYDNVVAAVRDRLVALFNKQLLLTGTSRQLYGKLVTQQDSFQEQPNFAGITLHFRFGWLSIP